MKTSVLLVATVVLCAGGCGSEPEAVSGASVKVAHAEHPEVTASRGDGQAAATASPNALPSAAAPPPPPPDNRHGLVDSPHHLGDPSVPGLPVRRKATVQAASTSSMSGQFTPEQVELVVDTNIDAFAPCALGEVSVSLRALIAATGKVTSVSASRSIPDDARMRDCVLEVFRTLQFPASHDGKSEPMMFDLVLTAPP